MSNRTLLVLLGLGAAAAVLFAYAGRAAPAAPPAAGPSATTASFAVPTTLGVVPVKAAALNQRYLALPSFVLR